MNVSWGWLGSAWTSGWVLVPPCHSLIWCRNDLVMLFIVEVFLKSGLGAGNESWIRPGVWGRQIRYFFWEEMENKGLVPTYGKKNLSFVPVLCSSSREPCCPRPFCPVPTSHFSPKEKDCGLWWRPREEGHCAHTFYTPSSLLHLPGCCVSALHLDWIGSGFHVVSTPVETQVCLPEADWRVLFFSCFWDSYAPCCYPGKCFFCMLSFGWVIPRPGIVMLGRLYIRKPGLDHDTASLAKYWYFDVHYSGSCIYSSFGWELGGERTMINFPP